MFVSRSSFWNLPWKLCQSFRSRGSGRTATTVTEFTATPISVKLRLSHIVRTDQKQKGYKFLSSNVSKMKCYLECCDSYSLKEDGFEVHKPIFLTDMLPVIIGRSAETLIQDKACSRKQVVLTANYKKAELLVKQLGAHSSYLNDSPIEAGTSKIMKENDTLHILSGLYPHKVIFYGEERRSDKAIKRTTEKSESSNKKKLKQEQQDHSGEKRSDKAIKRKNTEESESSCRKKLKLEQQDNSGNEGEDSEGEREALRAKLDWMKKQVKKDQVVTSSPPPPRSSITGAEGGEGEPARESTWQEHGKLQHYTSKGLVSRPKIASYDVDGTIITTASGKVFPTHIGDWRFLYPEVPGKLKSLHKEGYKIVFFTNQLGVEKKKVSVADIRKKFVSIVDKVGVPIQVLMSTGRGEFRKPQPGMWDFFTSRGNDGIAVDMKNSYYVGDAAGRPVNWEPKKKKDHACSDRLFAVNVELSFLTPEQHFLGRSAPPYSMPEFDPKKLDSSAPLLDPPTAKLASTKTEVVIMCGSPASGKSFVAHEHLVTKGYKHVSRDMLGTWQKCVGACRAAVRAGQSVVVDNTNPDVESRARYLECAKEAGVPCRCFVMTTTLVHAKHNEKFRKVVDPSHQGINDMVMNSFKGKFQEPKLAEGFSEVVKVNFVPRFDKPSHERLYNMFLLEK